MRTAFSSSLPARWLGAAALLFAGGCGGGPAAGLTLEGLAVDEADFSWLALEATLRLAAPRPLQLRLVSLDHTLEVAGRPWLAGDSDGDGDDGFRITADPDDPTRLRLPLGIAQAALQEAQQATRGSDTLPAVLRIAAVLDDGGETVAVDIDHDFGLLALRPPTLAPTGLAVDWQDEDRAWLDLELALDNDMGMAVAVDATDLQISVDGVVVHSGPVAALAALPGATTETVTLRAAVERGQGGGVLAAALDAGEAEVAVTAALVVDTALGPLPHDSAAAAVLRF